MNNTITINPQEFLGALQTVTDRSIEKIVGRNKQVEKQKWRETIAEEFKDNPVYQALKVCIDAINKNKPEQNRMNVVDYLKDCRTVHIRAGRRTGHTSALLFTGYQYKNPVVIVPRPHMKQLIVECANDIGLNAEQFKIYCADHLNMAAGQNPDVVLIDNVSYMTTQQIDEIYSTFSMNPETLFLLAQ